MDVLKSPEEGNLGDTHVSPVVILRGNGPHEDNNFKIESDHSRKSVISHIACLVFIKQTIWYGVYPFYNLKCQA
jgi:hypothetical protein